MIWATSLMCQKKVALLAEGVDRNRKKGKATAIEVESPSSRRAWIEMDNRCLVDAKGIVALLAEGVDRNVSHFGFVYLVKVALLAEGVDRNRCTA